MCVIRLRCFVYKSTLLSVFHFIFTQLSIDGVANLTIPHKYLIHTTISFQPAAQKKLIDQHFIGIFILFACNRNSNHY